MRFLIIFITIYFILACIIKIDDLILWTHCKTVDSILCTHCKMVDVWLKLHFRGWWIGWIISFKLLNHEWDVLSVLRLHTTFKYIYIDVSMYEIILWISRVTQLPQMNFFGFELIINYDNLSCEMARMLKNDVA